MGGWTPEYFSTALAQLTPTYEAFDTVIRGLVTGEVQVVSGGFLVPDVFGGPDAGLANSSLGIPQHSTGYALSCLH